MFPNQTFTLIVIISLFILHIFALALGHKRPVFTATLNGRPTLSETTGIVKFDNVILNREGGYDPKTGLFTAPRTGLYQISVTIMSDGGKDLCLHIAKNKQILLYLYGAGLNGATETANPGSC